MANGNGNGNGQHASLGDGSALVVSKDPVFRMAMEPVNLDGMYKMAVALHKVALCGVKSPEEALSRMLCGRELGLTMMQAMRGVHVIEGQPSLSAALKEAICLSHPEVCEEFVLVDTTDQKATYRVKRRGRTAREYTFTMEDASRAGLVKDKSGWVKYPSRMLMARAKSAAADAEFADLLLGFATREEMEDERTITVRAIPQPERAAGQVTVDAEMVPPSSPDVNATAQPAVSAPARDFDAEVAALKEEIAAAKTKEQRSALRKKVAAFVADAGEPYASDVKGAYNAAIADKGSDAAAAATG